MEIKQCSIWIKTVLGHGLIIYYVELKKYNIDTRIKIPAYSPELSSIEHAWSWLGGRLAKMGPNDEAELTDCLGDIWSELTVELCQGILIT